MHIFSKFSSFFLCCLFVANHSFAQGLSVNATGSAADTSAMLDVSSTSKGMLVPRMTTAQRNAIALPATGLMIYQTDGTAGFYYYTGSAWGVVGGSSLPTGIAGDVLYNDGSNWVASGTGTSGQTLMLVSGVPTWVTFPFYYISATSSTNGTVSPAGIKILSPGASQVYSITPSSGYVVGSLTVDGSSVSVVPTYTFTSVGASHTISASFVVTPSVGASYGGGKLAYILVSGDPGYSSTTVHGLIAATSDQSTAALWYNGTYTVTGATGTAVGSGLSNTMAIIANQGAGSYAAQLCHAYTGGGYTDWYLPSKDELNKLYINLTAIGGFASNIYWSSSEYNSSVAWYQNFVIGVQAGDSKVNVHYVRAVRAF